ncbi:MAG TPA: hypothetical protein VNP94_13140 [Actinomycetota bacterium]|nr:hypothetical protein [Actinomycetota bacterium]
MGPLDGTTNGNGHGTLSGGAGIPPRPATEPRQPEPSVDPSALAKRVEQEVAAVLRDATQAAAEIRTRAAEAAREVLVGIGEAQRDLERVAERIRALLGQAEQVGPATAAAVETLPGEPSPPEAPGVEARTLAPPPSFRAQPEGGGVVAPFARARAVGGLSVTDDVVRALRENLT